MSSNENQSNSTKTFSEEHSFVWKIYNFYYKQSSKFLIANQQVFFETGAGVNLPTKWKCCMQKSLERNRTRIWLRLLDSPMDACKIQVNLQVHCTTGTGYKWFESSFTKSMSQKYPYCWESLPGLICDGYCTKCECEETGGALVLHVSVTVFNLEQPELQNLYYNHLRNWENFSQKLSESKNILEKKSAKVFIISSDHRIFPVARDMLCAQSPVFERMFQSEMVERNGVVKISDISGEVLKLLLEYITTGILEKAWTQPEIIKEFVYATNKYMIKDLLQFEDKMLGYYGTRENVDALLDLAESFGLNRAVNDLKDLKNKPKRWGEVIPYMETVSTVWEWVEPFLNFWTICICCRIIYLGIVQLSSLYRNTIDFLTKPEF